MKLVRLLAMWTLGILLTVGLTLHVIANIALPRVERATQLPGFALTSLFGEGGSDLAGKAGSFQLSVPASVVDLSIPSGLELNPVHTAAEGSPEVKEALTKVTVAAGKFDLRAVRFAAIKYYGDQPGAITAAEARAAIPRYLNVDEVASNAALNARDGLTRAVTMIAGGVAALALTLMFSPNAGMNAGRRICAAAGACLLFFTLVPWVIRQLVGSESSWLLAPGEAFIGPLVWTIVFGVAVMLGSLVVRGVGAALSPRSRKLSSPARQQKLY